MSPIPLLCVAVPCLVAAACLWLREPGSARGAAAVAQGGVRDTRPLDRRPDWWLTISLVSAGDAWFLAMPTAALEPTEDGSPMVDVGYSTCLGAINWAAIKASAGSLTVSCVDLNAATVVR